MAKMLPYPVQNFNNQSEEKIYRLFEKSLNDDYTVLYSRSWTQVESGYNSDVECDFIILRPGHGIVVVEVKGGRWECKNGIWHAYGTPATDHDDPFKQAKDNKFALMNFLLKNSGKRFYFPISYAVALPDTVLHDGFNTTGLPPILSFNDLRFIDVWVASAMQECVQQNHPNSLSQGAFDFVIQVLLKDYVMNLKDIFEITENELAFATEQQMVIDKNLRKQKRLTVQGCAGSGKTLLALRSAKRLSSQDEVRNIFFTCFNKELGSWLEKQNQSIQNKCLTKPYLEYCESILTEHGVLKGDEKKDQEYYDNLPTLMLDLIELHQIKFDAIIVDEGQSFHSDWWVVLESMLSDKKNSYFYIFYDERQRIYNENWHEVPKENESFPLTVNIRNTASIHKKAIQFLPPDDYLPECNNVKGETPWFYVYDGEKTMKKALRKVLTTLIIENRVSSKDIVILRGKNKTSQLRDNDAIGPFTLSELEKDGNASSVRFTTIQSYRGMERKVVILTELDEEVRNIEQLNYLGASRAKAMLVYVVSRSIAAELLNALEKDCQIRNQD